MSHKDAYETYQKRPFDARCPALRARPRRPCLARRRQPPVLAARPAVRPYRGQKGTYLSPKPFKCCPISLMTSSSDWESLFFFLRLLPSSGMAEAAAPPGTPLLTLRLLLLLPAAGAAGRSPLAWARSPADDDGEGDDSPFCADRQASSWVWPWPPPPPLPPAPLACMTLPLTRLGPLPRRGPEAAAGAAAAGTPTTTTTEDDDDAGGGERPVRPAEAPGSPTPSAAEARGFFRGGGEAPPASESEEEEAEARVSSPREAVVGSRGGETGAGVGRGPGSGRGDWDLSMVTSGEGLSQAG